MSSKQKMFNLKKTAIIISLSLTAITSANSSGGLNLISDDASLQQQYQEKYFSQSGISGEETTPIVATGADMPLALAVSILVPKNWKVETSGDFQSAIVSWKGGVAWPLILRNIAQDEQIYITLDWIRKVANINVPGTTQSEKQYQKQAKVSLSEEKQSYKIKDAQQWQKRDDNKTALNSERQKSKSFIDNQKEAQESNQLFIAQLNQTNEQFARDKISLEQALKFERNEKQALIEKYSVINPSFEKENITLDATDLFDDHNKRWVLPFDSSFDYFIKGGHTDKISYLTPATFVAKKGTINDVIGNWANELNWHIEYRAGVQHYNPYQVEFKGSFFEASVELISIFKDSKRPLDITFHPDVMIGNRKGLVTITDLNYERGQ